MNARTLPKNHQALLTALKKEARENEDQGLALAILSAEHQPSEVFPWVWVLSHITCFLNTEAKAWMGNHNDAGYPSKDRAAYAEKLASLVVRIARELRHVSSVGEGRGKS